MTRDLIISTGKSRFDKGREVTTARMTWDDVVTMLSKFRVSKLTRAEFDEMSDLDKQNIKDTGYYVGGQFDPPFRRAPNLKLRSIITMDLDNLDPWDLETIIDTYQDHAFVMHSSLKHTEDAPRVRLIFPLTRDVNDLEYRAISRKLAARFDINLFDDTCHQPSRLFYLPKRFSDQEKYFHLNKGQWIDPDKILSEYEDWQDFAAWPWSDKELDRGAAREHKDKAANPFEIPGIIGAFNRAYPIDEAIEEFGLPYAASGTGEDRYSYLEGTGVDGAIFYADDGKFHSHHDTDPAHGQTNCWDLVRLHRFGDLDSEKDLALPIRERPSQKAMVEFAQGLGPVIEEWGDGARRSVVAEEEFEEVNIDDSGKKEVKRVKADFKTLMKEIGELPENIITAEEWKRFIQRFAFGKVHNQISPTELAVLIEALRPFHPFFRDKLITKKAVEEELNDYVKSKNKELTEEDGTPKDIQYEFLANFEEEYYHNGAWIRRAGKQFWKYTGTYWKKIDEEVVGGQLGRSLKKLRTSDLTKKEKAALIAAVGENTSSAIKASLWQLYQHEKAAETVEIARSLGLEESDPMGLARTGLMPGINCLSGEIEFNDHGQYRLQPHRTNSLYTGIINANLQKDAECPTWDAFCASAFQLCEDPTGMQRHLEEFMGYTVNQSRRMRTWGMLYGPTGSGKTTVAKVLEALMKDGAKFMSMRNYSGDNSHATAGLVGKYALIDDDYPTNVKLPDAFLKQVSEEKSMGANPKGKDELTFISRVVTLICSNHPPRTDDVSGALFDRALVFPFSYSVPVKDRDEYLIDKLREEIDGIFLRLVKGCGRLFKRGGWDIPVDARKAKAQWQKRSNPLEDFFSDYIAEDEGAVLWRPDAWKEYEHYLEDQGLHMGKAKGPLFDYLESKFGRPAHQYLDHEHLTGEGKPTPRMGWKGWRLSTPAERNEEYEAVAGVEGAGSAGSRVSAEEEFDWDDMK